MKKIKVSGIISVLLIGFIVLLSVSPDTRAWISRGLMKVGLFKPDLEQTDPEEKPVNGAVSAEKTGRNTPVYFADGSGNRIDAANQDDKVVFINFWATWCPPCIAEMPSIEKLYDNFKDNDNMVFIIADVDNKYEQSVSFMKNKKLNLPVHVPVDNIPGHWLGGAIPTTLILDKRGDIVVRHEGMADYSRPEVMDFIQKLIDD